MAFAFRALNLRRNPFGEPHPEERAALAVTDVGDHALFLSGPRRVLQLMGDGGRGKSTHLHALRAQRPAPYVYFAEGERFHRIPRGPLAYIDEAQRMHPLLRAHTFRGARSFAIATHEDLSSELGRRRFEVRTLTVGVKDPTALAAILERRLDWARANGPGPSPSFTPEAVAALQHRFGDDLRSLEDHLYEVFQALSESRPLGPEDVAITGGRDEAERGRTC